MPLHIAASRGSLSVCKALLGASAPAGLINEVTLLKDEQHSGQWGKKDANTGELHKLPAAGPTALHMAVQLLHDAKEEAADEGEEDEFVADLQLVSTLLAHGARPNMLDGDSSTPLHKAIMGGLHDVAELLLKAGADPTLGCKAIGMANTALHQAVLRGDEGMVRVLVRAAPQLDVNAAGQNGLTPLCLAARSNQAACATALVEGGADPKLLTPFGKSALDIARTNKRAAILQLFGEDA